MAKQKFDILPSQIVSELEKGEFQRIEVHFETCIIYEGHIPHVGYLLLHGEAFLCKRGRPLQKLQQHSLIGVEELFSHSPFKWELRVSPGTALLVLDRSTLLEILNDRDHTAHSLIKDLIAV